MGIYTPQHMYVTCPSGGAQTSAAAPGTVVR
jgi:hypothetical protein